MGMQDMANVVLHTPPTATEARNIVLFLSSLFIYN